MANGTTDAKLQEETQAHPVRFGRQTAVKVWISNLVNGTFVTNTTDDPNHVLSGNSRISRANLMGVIVQKSAAKVLNYDYVTIDDGSGRITARAFENRQLLADFQIGDMVNILGKPREYGTEIYLVPEIARKIDNPLWLEVRKQELAGLPQLTDTTPTPPKKQAEKTEETTAEEDTILTPHDTLLQLIRTLDEGSGVDVNEILSQTRIDQAEKILQTLLMRGDVFEIRPGKVKVLE